MLERQIAAMEQSRGSPGGARHESATLGNSPFASDAPTSPLKTAAGTVAASTLPTQGHFGGHEDPGAMEKEALEVFQAVAKDDKLSHSEVCPHPNQNALSL